MLDRFREAIAREDLIPEGTRVLVGYSGGADSTCLLDLLHRAGLDVVAAHLHHGQRPEADEEERLCAQFCSSLDVPLVVGRANVPTLAKQMRVGIEEAGRSARYDLFERAAAETGCQRIATAHTLDDHVETILLNLVRGAGIGGLAGIPRARGRVVRPLLGFQRSETRAYCVERNLWFHDDPVNTDLARSRSLIRASVIPVLEQVNPAVREAMARLARLASAEDEFLDAAAAAALERCELEKNGSLRFLTMDREVWLDRGRLLHLPDVLLSRSLRLATAVLGATLDYAQTEAALSGIRGGGSGSVTPEGGRVALEWRESEVGIRILSLGSPPTVSVDLPFVLDDPSGTWRMEADRVSSNTLDHGPLEATIDADAPSGPLQVRPARVGESIRPLGLAGTKKVSDVMADAKLTSVARACLPMVADEQGVVWIPSLALADRVKITDRTNRCLRIRMGPAPQGSHNKETASPNRT